MELGDRIRHLREKNGMSQVDLANSIGISKQTMYKYENGIITNIPSDKIELISKIFDVSPAYIMGWDPISTSNFHITEFEKNLIIEFRKSCMQEAVCKLLGLSYDMVKEKEA